MRRPVEEIQWLDTQHRCGACNTTMHRAEGSTFLKCFYCGAEGYEVPVN